MRKTIKITISIIFGLLILGLLAYAGIFFYLKSTGTIPTITEKETKKGKKIEIKKDFLGYTIVASRNTPLDLIVDEASKIAGFRVYCPSFVPKEFISDPIKIFISKDADMADCNLGVMGDLESAWIAILQKPIKPNEENSLLSKAQTLKLKQAISFNGNQGYTGFKETEKHKFNHLIFSTKDNVAVQIYSKDFDVDILTQIAKSMK